MIVIDNLRPSRWDTRISKELDQIIEENVTRGFLKEQNRSHQVWAQNFSDINSINETSLINKHQSGPILGWELSPAIIAYFTRLNIEVFSMGISPLRFKDDLDLYVISNTDVQGLRNFDRYICDNSQQSQIMNSKFNTNTDDILEGQNVIFEQLPLDAASIRDGKFLGIIDLIEEFDLKNYVIVSHPHSRVISRHSIKLKNLAYSALLNRADLSFFSVSSSLNYEASCFGRNVSCLHDYYRDAYQGENIYCGSLAEVTSALSNRIEEKFVIPKDKSLKELLEVSWW